MKTGLMASINPGHLNLSNFIYKSRKGSVETGGELQNMVSQGRFELPTFPLGGGCSIQLSY